jgi:hypothetical protein
MSLICVSYGCEIECSSACSLLPGVWAAISTLALRCPDSTTCRIRKSRGADLAYLTALPPDQARARRMRHDADESEIAIGRMAGASRREGRDMRGNLLKVKRMKTART